MEESHTDAWDAYHAGIAEDVRRAQDQVPAPKPRPEHARQLAQIRALQAAARENAPPVARGERSYVIEGEDASAEAALEQLPPLASRRVLAQVRSAQAAEFDASGLRDEP